MSLSNNIKSLTSPTRSAEMATFMRRVGNLLTEYKENLTKAQLYFDYTMQGGLFSPDGDGHWEPVFDNNDKLIVEG